jgi:hypothetical protein
VDKLQEMVRLYRKGVGCRETSRLLKMSPNTERLYRVALSKTGLLEGDEYSLPSLEELQDAVKKVLPESFGKQQVSSVLAWKGCVETVIPDNLKSAVIRAAFNVNDVPKLNRSYREFARYYGVKIDPTPIYSPNKKGKVESGVKYVKNNFFKPREFKDIDDANNRLKIWTLEIAGKRIHGTTGKMPLDVFCELEQPVLKPLPKIRYEPVIWAELSVHRDSRIQFEGRLYPVHWQNIGKKVWIRATRLSIEIYLNNQRIDAHPRNRPVSREVYKKYLPEMRAEYGERSRQYWEQKAEAIGKETQDYIKEVFDSDEVLSMLRQVQAIVTFLEKYPKYRAEAACKRASFYGNYQYKSIKTILEQALDFEPLPCVTNTNNTTLNNPRFARKPYEFN